MLKDIASKGGAITGWLFNDSIIGLKHLSTIQPEGYGQKRSISIYLYSTLSINNDWLPMFNMSCNNL